MQTETLSVLRSTINWILKLRIQDNSLRLRLSRTEVAELRDEGRVERAIEFPGGRSLIYAVAGSGDTSSVAVNFTGDTVCVKISSPTVAAWADSDQVTIEGNDSGVKILVEKDFQCLHQPDGPDPDGYPNPEAE